MLSPSELAALVDGVSGDPGAKARAGEALAALQRGALNSTLARALSTSEGAALLRRYSRSYGDRALRELLTPIPGLRLPAGDASAMVAAVIAQLPNLQFTALRTVETLARAQAEQIVESTLQQMGAPTDIPVVLPKRLTPEAVADAAYASGKRYAEDWLEGQTGVPIKLPDKLSVKELEEAVIGWVPSDVEELIDTGLAIGAQYAATAITSAATSALIGAGIGSVIPGLGTIIGIGVAIAIGELKDEIKGIFAEDPQPYETKCQTPWTCPDIPQLSPIELLPWITQQRVPATEALAKEQAVAYCGRGSLVECNDRLRTLEVRMYEASLATPQVLGREQVVRLIALYEAVPKNHFWYDIGRIQPGGTSTRGTRTVIQLPNREVQLTLQRLKKRLATLDYLVSRSKRVMTLPPSDLASLRWDLASELSYAALQVQNTETEEAKRWLKAVAALFAKYQAREDADYAQMSAQAGVTPSHECVVRWTSSGAACQICENRVPPDCAKDVPGLMLPRVNVVNPTLTDLACRERWIAWLRENPDAAASFPLAGDPYFRQLCQEVMDGTRTDASMRLVWAAYAEARQRPSLVRTFFRHLLGAGTV